MSSLSFRKIIKFGIKLQAWKGIKWLVWKSVNIAGEQWGNRVWMAYSLMRVFILANIARTFVNEPEGELIKKIVKKDQICFDIGASVGTYTYLLSSLVGPNGVVHSFEPLPRSFDVLKKTVRVFHLNNVICHPVCLGDRVSVIEFTGGNGRPGTTYTAHIRGADELEITDFQLLPMITLNTLVSEQRIKQVDFIKCDVEGAELLVFQAGKDVLRRYRPIVMCEVDPIDMMRYKFSTGDIFSFFKECEYQSFAWRGNKLLSLNCFTQGIYNYIFLPEERLNVIFSSLSSRNSNNPNCSPPLHGGGGLIMIKKETLAYQHLASAGSD